MQKHIYFVRHGETDSNADGIFKGHESMLTDLGREQALLIADRATRLTADALVSSTFVRALDTAQAISGKTGLQVERNDDLVEWKEPSIIFGRHKDDPEIKELHLKMMDRDADENHRIHDEETFAELKLRAKKVLAFLENHPADRICVVTHGSFLRVIIGTVLYREDFTSKHFSDLFFHMVTTNTGITYVRNINENGWQLVTWNDSSHLG